MVVPTVLRLTQPLSLIHIWYGTIFDVKGFLEIDKNMLDNFEGYPPIIGDENTCLLYTSLHDMLLIACALWNQLPVLRFSLASTEMMYPCLLYTSLFTKRQTYEKKNSNNAIRSVTVQLFHICTDIEGARI